MDFELNGKRYGYLNPYVIAEIGVNHEGSLSLAKELITSAANAGASAAKFQTYSAAKLAAKSSSPAYWDTTKEATTSQYQLFQKYDSFGQNEYSQLSLHCAEEGIDFLSTPFDSEAVDLLNPFVPVYKVASADITNVPLLRKVASKNKPVIISSGASTLSEIDTAIHTLEAYGSPSVSILHCVLNYPTKPENANLSSIFSLIHEYGSKHSIGYSDHVAPDFDGKMPALVSASIMGATIIEKHFTLDRSLPGNDHYHATDPISMGAFIQSLTNFRILFGNSQNTLESQTDAIVNARRRIFSNKTLLKGHIIQETDLIPLRSNEGIEISNWDKVIGSKTLSTIEADSPILWEQISC